MRLHDTLTDTLELAGGSGLSLDRDDAAPAARPEDATASARPEDAAAPAARPEDAAAPAARPAVAPRLDLDRHARAPYAAALDRYADTGFSRLDVPGHQARPEEHPGLTAFFGARVLELDVPMLTEGIDLAPRTVDGGPVGPSTLAEARALAADAWGARATWFLTNGASKGNLVTCLALRALGEHVVVQRSVHSSVVDGMAMAGLQGHFVQPTLDTDLGMAHGVTAADLDRRLSEHPEAVAAYVVTPSYFGAVADVAALADVAHAHGVPLVVDEAWGSHFGFHEALPVNAIRLGADVVISSTHKLAGSLTQSAMLHLGHGPYADRLEPLLDRAFRSMQSTSASALLMASLDLARRDLVLGTDRIAASVACADEIRAAVDAGGRFRDVSARILAAPDVVGIDPLRVVIDTRSGGISGHEARHVLFAEHDVHVEMSTDSVIVALIGAGSTVDVDRFAAALHALPETDLHEVPVLELPAAGPRALSVRDAYFADTEVVSAAAAIGRVSADSLAAYPPGIPNVLPGEVVTAEVVAFLQETAAAPYGYVRGALDPAVGTLRVVR